MWPKGKMFLTFYFQALFNYPINRQNFLRSIIPLSLPIMKCSLLNQNYHPKQQFTSFHLWIISETSHNPSQLINQATFHRTWVSFS
jgi:hypothetical protein